MELTFDQAVDAHRKMWNWIADKSIQNQRIMDKEDYLFDVGLYEKLDQNCFLCQYAGQIDGDACRYCPLIWNEKEVEGLGCFM